MRSSLVALALVGAFVLPACTPGVAEAVDDSISTDAGDGPSSDSDESELTDTESSSESESESESTQDSSSDTGSDDSFRVVILAAPQVIGPSYAGDDPSLLVTAEQLDIVRWELEQISPPPDFALILGDLVHEAYPTQDLGFYQNNPNAFATLDTILDAFPCPVYPVFGDGDYGIPDVPRAFSHNLFALFFAKEPYYLIEHEGWRFVVTNSQIGQTFEPPALLYDPELGSYGASQLSWVADQLDDGVPSVLLTHFPVGTTALNEAVNNGPAPDMLTLLTENPGSLELIFAGHSQVWASTPGEFGAPQYELGSTRYDTDNFLLVEFGIEGSYELLDIDKVQWNTPNADHWNYENGTPVPAE